MKADPFASNEITDRGRLFIYIGSAASALWLQLMNREFTIFA